MIMHLPLHQRRLDTCHNVSLTLYAWPIDAMQFFNLLQPCFSLVLAVQRPMECHMTMTRAQPPLPCTSQAGSYAPSNALSKKGSCSGTKFQKASCLCRKLSSQHTIRVHHNNSNGHGYKCNPPPPPPSFERC